MSAKLLVERVDQRLEVVDLRAAAVAEDAVGVAEIHDRDDAERVGELLDRLESVATVAPCWSARNRTIRPADTCTASVVLVFGPPTV